jgi:hypothetical protein
MIVPARAGTIPIHVIFDTGAGLDALAPSLIQRLGSKPAGQFTAFRMTGERLDIPLFIVPELSIGPVMKKDAVSQAGTCWTSGILTASCRSAAFASNH